MKIFILVSQPNIEYFLNDLVLLCSYNVTKKAAEANAIISDSNSRMDYNKSKFPKDVATLIFSQTAGRTFLKKLLDLAP